MFFFILGNVAYGQYLPLRFDDLLQLSLFGQETVEPVAQAAGPIAVATVFIERDDALRLAPCQVVEALRLLVKAADALGAAGHPERTVMILVKADGKLRIEPSQGVLGQCLMAGIVAEDTLSEGGHPHASLVVAQEVGNGGIDGDTGRSPGFQGNVSFFFQIEQGESAVAPHPQMIIVVLRKGKDGGTRCHRTGVAPYAYFVSVKAVKTVDGTKPHAPFVILGNGINGIDGESLIDGIVAH